MKYSNLSNSSHRELIKYLSKKSILICCGLGGVGKTSLSTSFALELAKRGKRVCLITVDPAKRLATAMNLNKLTSTASDLSHYIKEHIEDTENFGSLSALTFHAPSSLKNFIRKEKGEELLKKLEKNKLYKVLTENLSGIHEYFVVEKIYELSESNAYDIIVTDTPPNRHTLDFLEAPKKISSFFKNKALQWFLEKKENHSFIQKLRMRSKKSILFIFKKIIGIQVFNELIELSTNLYELNKSFLKRQKEALKLLQSNKTEAIFISNPSNIGSWEFKKFYEDIKKQKIKASNIIINRSLMHLCPLALEEIPNTEKEKEPYFAYKNIYQLIISEKQNYKNIQKEIKKKFSFFLIPEKNEDISSIHTLEALTKAWRKLEK